MRVLQAALAFKVSQTQPGILQGAERAFGMELGHGLVRRKPGRMFIGADNAGGCR